MLMAAEPAKLERRSPEEPLVNSSPPARPAAPSAWPARTGSCAARPDYYDWMGIGPEDRIFCTIPLFHTYGMGCCMIAATRTGATLVLLEDPNPFLLRRQRALELLEGERITIFPGVPFNFRLLAEAPASADLSSLRLAFSAGHRAAAPVLRGLRRPLRRARPPALRLHRGRDAHREHGRRPGRQLRVGRRAGGRRGGAGRGRRGRAGRPGHGRRDHRRAAPA